MQFFASIINGIVVEIITIPAGAIIGNYFHADFAAALVPCAATITAGMQYANGVFTAAPPPPAPTVAQLIAYSNVSWNNLLTKGQTFNVAASGAPAVNILCDGTPSTRADLALLALYGQANPTGSKTWIDNNGVATALTGTELVTLASLAGNWISDTYPALQLLQVGITSATPTVTTTAQIDAFAWPTA